MNAKNFIVANIQIIKCNGCAIILFKPQPLLSLLEFQDALAYCFYNIPHELI